jgi:hypothetical protein
VTSASHVVPLPGSKLPPTTFMSPSVLILGFEPPQVTFESHVAVPRMLFLLLVLSMLCVSIFFLGQHQTLEGGEVPSLSSRLAFDLSLHHAQSLV